MEPMELNQGGLGEPGIWPVNNSTIQTLKIAVKEVATYDLCHWSRWDRQ